ncbi:LysR family transcriptional regulator [Lacisediminihabitans profunda]|uniref:LysR family transcriptional regulator n=1 Tax=Lacisediminihabitans profunda TaxID=2594790 RepID=A0A5C8UKS4_9MICO|nr:LysR family transcriptional regulator [Lacisediminihabitans profunda]TXN28942.1 LysR family transcriptional regulator [Lacisediminihabitans profunda]
MTLIQMRVFLMAAQLGSFTAAAAALHMAQPSVSEFVKRIEDAYGMRLFVRGGRRLILTRAGEELLPLAEQTVANADAADRAMRAVASLSAGVASFGLLRNANYYSLAELLIQFTESYPGVRLRVVGLNSVEVARSVVTGELEAGLVVLPIDSEGLSVTPLRRDEVLYASADPTHLESPVTIADMSERNLILYDAHYGWRDPTRRQITERAQLLGIVLEARIEVEQVESALALVSAGGGDTFVARAVAESGKCPPNIGFVPFAEPLYDTVALIHRENAVLSPATAELIRFARRMLDEPEKAPSSP